MAASNTPLHATERPNTGLRWRPFILWVVFFLLLGSGLVLAARGGASVQPVLDEVER